MEKPVINIIDINVITNEAHLGIWKNSRILPVRVQSAIAIIIEAKNNMIISFILHKINMEITNMIIEEKLVGFKLNINYH